MKRPAFIAHQAGRPTGLLGHMIAAVMERETQALNRRVVDLLNPGPGDRVLDVGTGNGSSLRYLAKRTRSGVAVGIDHSTVMCKRAEKTNADLVAAGRVRVCCAFSDALPFESGYFGAAMSVHTLYFWDPAERHLREIARVLRPGAHFILAFRPAGAAATSDFPATVYRFRSMQEVEDLLFACGFEAARVIGRDMGDDSVVLLSAIRNNVETSALNSAEV